MNISKLFCNLCNSYIHLMIPYLVTDYEGREIFLITDIFLTLPLCSLLYIHLYWNQFAEQAGKRFCVKQKLFRWHVKLKTLLFIKTILHITKMHTLNIKICLYSIIIFLLIVHIIKGLYLVFFLVFLFFFKSFL